MRKTKKSGSKTVNELKGKILMVAGTHIITGSTYIDKRPTVDKVIIVTTKNNS